MFGSQQAIINFSLFSFLPVIIILFYVYKRDRFPEPPRTVFITLICITLSIIIAIFAAYALKRYKIRFKTAFMQWLLLAYMLPEFLFVLPMFAIYQSIGIYDTYIGMALIYQVHVLPFSIWMLRSFLEEIPKEIDDAAYLDGCNPFLAIYKIYLPLIIPGIVATAILNGIWVWNELAIALGLAFFDAQPITVGVASFRGYASINWGGMTGSAIESMIPMILFVTFAHKQIGKGLTLGSVKGLNMIALNNPKFLLNNKTFPTIYGRNLLHELNIIIPNETLIVTMEDLWDNFSSFFSKNVQVHLVNNLDINSLDNDFDKIKNFNAVVGIGGGQALDNAKFFSWKSNKKLFQVPTSMSVNAAFGHRFASRIDGKINYIGRTVPEAIYVDYDIIK